MLGWLFRITLFIALALAGLSVFFYVHIHEPLAFHAEHAEFHIPSGASLRQAALLIRKAGVDVDDRAFVLLTHLEGNARNIKAGSYEIRRGVNTRQLLRTLIEGAVSTHTMRLIEGRTLRQWRATLNAHPRLRHDTEGLSDAELASRLNITQQSLEGWLFPDTYFFDADASDFSILERSHRLMKQKLAEAWRNRADGLPYQTPYEALILASIVEKETGRSADRPLIAAVFVNRLRRGMFLQADPTVIYGLGETFDGNLRKKDLRTDTPYNSYTRVGLPPTPIAMVSEASLRSALHPSSSKALYFVATGDGGSVFSDNLADHARAVRRYQLKRH